VPARLISKAELARMRGVGKPAITKAAAGPLAPAMVGERVNLDHPLVQAYLKSAPKSGRAPARAPTKPSKSNSAKPGAPTKAAGSAKKSKAAPTAPGPEPSVPPPPRVPAPKDSELEQMRELLRPLTERFGTATAFKDWLAASKSIEEIQQKRLSNEEARGRLISREFVSAHVFGALGGMTRKLLRDTPKTLARRVLGLGQGATVEDAERLIREHISAQIGPVKDKVTRTLRSLDDAADLSDETA
jgi:hypothetical protein